MAIITKTIWAASLKMDKLSINGKIVAGITVNIMFLITNLCFLSFFISIVPYMEYKTYKTRLQV